MGHDGAFVEEQTSSIGNVVNDEFIVVLLGVCLAILASGLGFSWSTTLLRQPNVEKFGGSWRLCWFSLSLSL